MAPGISTLTYLLTYFTCYSIIPISDFMIRLGLNVILTDKQMTTGVPVHANDAKGHVNCLNTSQSEIRLLFNE